MQVTVFELFGVRMYHAGTESGARRAEEDRRIELEGEGDDLCVVGRESGSFGAPITVDGRRLLFTGTHMLRERGAVCAVYAPDNGLFCAECTPVGYAETTLSDAAARLRAGASIDELMRLERSPARCPRASD